MSSTLLGLCLLLQASPGAPPSAPETPALPELRLEDLERWRAEILPAPEERAFEAIPWIPSFAAGVRRAAEEGRPLLFWAMNGHPLGCT